MIEAVEEEEDKGEEEEEEDKVSHCSASMPLWLIDKSQAPSPGVKGGLVRGNEEWRRERRERKKERLRVER